MNNTDFITMLGNISRALGSVTSLLTGLSYLLGIAFVIISLMKYRELSKNSMSQEGRYVATIFLGMGCALLFLPSMVHKVSNTFFGTSNVLQYVSYHPNDIYNSMIILIQTTGLVWFIRGCSLVVTSGQPGTKLGPKGFVFIGAGILAMNFQSTVGGLSYLVQSVFHIQLGS